MRHVEMRNLTIIFVIIICLSSCHNRQDSVRLSDRFYKEYRLEYLKSDLTKYCYNPRSGFTKQNDSICNFRVLIFQESAIRVLGTGQFNKEFNMSIDTAFWTDVVISKLPNNDLALSSANKEIKTKQTIKKYGFNLNPVDYFLNLKKKIDTYNVIAIEKHPSVNTIELIFSDHDYLIYKPDSLVFKTEDTEFMKYLFKDGKKLDNNWYQFNTEKNIDYN